MGGCRMAAEPRPKLGTGISSPWDHRPRIEGAMTWYDQRENVCVDACLRCYCTADGRIAKGAVAELVGDTARRHAEAQRRGVKPAVGWMGE